MDRSLALFAIGLVFGGGIGFVVAAGNGFTFDGHDHGDTATHGDAQMDHAAMGHAMMHDTPLDIPAENAPVVSMTLEADPMQGYNLHALVNNFEFSPEHASLAHVPGAGHAHVYINGEKVARLYGPWMHIDALPEGEVTIKITLNSNDHRPLAVNGEPIFVEAVLILE